MCVSEWGKAGDKEKEAICYFSSSPVLDFF